MAICRICGAEYYNQTEWEPEEKCICEHGVRHESPWQYAKFRGLFAWFRYNVVRKWSERLNRWVYSPWEL